MGDKRWRAVIAVTGIGLLFVVWGRVPASAGHSSSADVRRAALNATSPIPTPCPMPTAEPFSVDPVTSPTWLLSQVVTAHLGNGEAVTVSAESGIFTVTGNFSYAGSPALVTVNLIPNTTHHLQVFGRVKPFTIEGCAYDGYTLSAPGGPFIIVQLSHGIYLPSVAK